MNKIDYIKKFLSQDGFSNAIYSGEESKPSGEILTPKRLSLDAAFDNADAFSNTANAKKLFTINLPVIPADPWDQFLDIDPSQTTASKNNIMTHLQKLFVEEKEEIRKLNQNADFCDDHRVFKSEKEIIAMREQFWKNVFNPWREWIQSKSEDAYPLIPFDKALSLIEFGAKNKRWDVSPFLERFVVSIPDDKINSWWELFNKNKEDLKSSVANIGDFFVQLESNLEVMMLSKKYSGRAIKYASKPSI